jgi:hypothetical protein
MFPFFRGDVVMISNTTNSIDIGEIIAFRIPERPVVILHRIIEKHESVSSGGEVSHC